jgi:ABC-type transport system involved in multi-copper enzyme maturation permease subunit
MGLRFGPGPVFGVELRAMARRRRGYAARAAFVGALLAVPALGLVVEATRPAGVGPGAWPASSVRLFGLAAYRVLALVQLTVALVAAPAAAADALGRGRARGPLGHLLVTDLSAFEIVFGATAARLAPVLALLLAAAPVALLEVVAFGTDPAAVQTLAAVSAGAAVLGASVAAGLSLRTNRTHEALLAAYALEAAWLLALPVWAGLSWGIPPVWLARANPYVLAQTPYNVVPVTPADGLRFLGAAAVLAAAVLALAALRLRAAALREPGAAPGRPRRPGLPALVSAAWRRLDALLPGPALDGNPVLWREWRNARRSRWLGAYWLVYALAVSAFTALGLHAFFNGQTARPDLVAVVGFANGFGLLAVAVRSAAAWSEERAAGQGGLDVLLATPLSASEIVRGKWWACYRSVLWVAVLPGLSAVVLAAEAPVCPYLPPWASPFSITYPLRAVDRVAVASVVIGQVLAYGAAVVSLGLWLATRFRRPTLAVVAAVVVFGLVTLVWPIYVETFWLLPRVDRNLFEGLAAASPIAGPIVTQMSMFSPSYGTARKVVPYAAAWLVTAGAAALFLRWRTVRTFDRSLGRMGVSGGGRAGGEGARVGRPGRSLAGR